MKYSREQIIEVLTAIKETCEENDCSICPFSSRGNCLVSSGGTSPEEWVLNKLKGGK